MNDKSYPPPPQDIVLTTHASAVSTVGMSQLLVAQANPFEEWLKTNIKEHSVTLEMPPDILTWISKLITYWSVAEWIQVGVYANLLGIDRKIGRTVLGNGISFDRITNLLKAKDLPVPPYCEELNRLFSKCAETRNLLAHGIWIKEMGSGEFCIQNPSNQWPKIKGEKAVSKKQYPEAFYPTDMWFLSSLEEMKKVIKELQRLDIDILSLLRE